MVKVDLYSITPEEFSNLIKEGVKEEIERLFQAQQNGKKPEKELLTRKETADLFGISLVCLHDWMKKGIVTPYKMGNRTYFRYSELVVKLSQSNESR
jgi:hypothetical protein